VTDALESNTVYHAVLLAFDTEGGVSRTPPAQHRTARSTGSELLIFDEAPVDIPAAYTIPTCLVGTDAAGYEFRPLCIPPEVTVTNDSQVCESRSEHPPSCWVTLRWQDLGISTSLIPGGAFGDAHVEFVATLEGAHSNYGEFYLTLRSQDGADRGWGYVGGLSLRGEGMTRTYQIPLGALVLTSDDGVAVRPSVQALTHADLNPNGQPPTFYRFAIGGIFDHNSSVQVRSLRIRY